MSRHHWLSLALLLGCSTGSERLPAELAPEVMLDGRDASADPGQVSAHPDAGALTSSEPDAGASVAPACAEQSLALEHVAPTLVLLLDQSGSMDQLLDDAERWPRVVEALTAPDGPVAKLQGELRFGLVRYTSNGGFGANPELPRTCPVLAHVESALGNYPELTNDLQGELPLGDSPGAESLAQVARELAAAPGAAPASLLWITDGNTDSCENASLFDEPVSTGLSVQALSEAYGLGIPTQLLSLGDETSDEALATLASAGAGGDPAAAGFRATTRVELELALASAVERVRSCEFQFSGQLPEQPRVAIGGTELALAEEDGWDQPSPQRLRLRGSACAAWRAGAALSLQTRNCP
jgi:hypothetical protein